jgi:hypothetical protein
MREPLTNSRFPYLPIRIDLRGRTYQLEALLDTGFNGHAALPVQLIPCPEARDGHMPGELADSSVVRFAYYRGTVTGGDLGSFPSLIVGMGDEPVLGRAISNRFRIVLDHGQQIIVEP